MSELTNQVLERQDAAFKFLQTKRQLWDNAEKLFHNQLNDFVSSNSKSQVFDPKLATLTLERGYRVMAQLPTGKVKPISKNDIGTSKLMNLLLDKYVLPNANAQFDFLTKMRMVDIYSNFYGNFFTLIDWDVKKNGYIGPDVWLLNIRDVFPQVGAMSLEDSDYVVIRTWKPLSYFESLRGQSGYKNIDKIIKELEKRSGSKDKRDSEAISKREEDQFPEQVAAKKAGFFEVYSQFEGDRWVDVCVDAEMEFRDIANPHENGEIPVTCKYSIPLMDDIMGMGDFERGGSMQMVVNSVWNLYLDAVKMSIFPPVLLNKDNIAEMSSIKWGAAAKWLVRNQINNAASTLQLSPQGISTFNNTYQVANAALLNLFGTSDTATTSQIDASMGKTPQALKMQANRENTRDNADRFYMEQYLKKTMGKMVNLLSKKQSKAITVRLFEEELKELQRSYPEIDQMYDEQTGKLTIDKKNTGSVLYDYELVSGSTYALDQQTQMENLQQMVSMFMAAQTPQGNMLAELLKQEGYNFKFGELFKRTLSNSGIQDWDKILEEQTQDEQVGVSMQNDQNMFLQALQQMQMQSAPSEPVITNQMNEPSNPTLGVQSPFPGEGFTG